MDGKYSPPLHWNNYELGSDRSEDIFVYFKETPKELYLVSFNNYDDQFGGSPTDINNKIFLDPKDHDMFSKFWDRLLKGSK